MQVKALYYEQVLPISVDEAWAFFSTPKNLNIITPPSMSFEILSTQVDHMYAGLMLCYRVSPIPSIRFGWVTEITHVAPKHYFVDEQRIGPYKLWHHEHHFEPHPDGVLVKDILHYAIGKGIFGRIAGLIWVDKQVENIFKYRKIKLNELFPKK